MPDKSNRHARLVPLLLAIGSAGFWECRDPDRALRFSESLDGPGRAAAVSEATGSLSEGLAVFRQGGAYGYLDAAGNVTVTARFLLAGSFSEGRAPVQVGSLWGYVDSRGELIIPPAFDWAGPFREGRAAISSAGEYRFIDAAGNPVGGLAFSDARHFAGGRAAVRFGDAEEGAWGFIDRQGRLAIPPVFSDVPRGFSGGYAVVTVAGEGRRCFGYIDTTGGFAMDSLFDAAGDFAGGLAPVGRGSLAGGRFRGAWTYVDTAGSSAFPGEWEWAGSFEGDQALVRGFDGAFSFIDRRGAPAGRLPDTLRPAAEWNGGIVSYTLRKAGSAFRGAGEWARSGRE